MCVLPSEAQKFRVILRCSAGFFEREDIASECPRLFLKKVHAAVLLTFIILFWLFVEKGWTSN